MLSQPDLTEEHLSLLDSHLTIKQLAKCVRILNDELMARIVRLQEQSQKQFNLDWMLSKESGLLIADSLLDTHFPLLTKKEDIDEWRRCLNLGPSSINLLMHGPIPDNHRLNELCMMLRQEYIHFEECMFEVAYALDLAMPSMSKRSTKQANLDFLAMVQATFIAHHHSLPGYIMSLMNSETFHYVRKIMRVHYSPQLVDLREWFKREERMAVRKLADWHRHLLGYYMELVNFLDGNREELSEQLNLVMEEHSKLVKEHKPSKAIKKSIKKIPKESA